MSFTSPLIGLESAPTIIHTEALALCLIVGRQGCVKGLGIMWRKATAPSPGGPAFFGLLHVKTNGVPQTANSTRSHESQAGSDPHPRPNYPRELILGRLFLSQNLQVPLAFQRRQIDIRHHPYRNVVQRQLPTDPDLPRLRRQVRLSEITA